MTTSHTLPSELVDKLRLIAYESRVSESSVIECALHRLFENDDAHVIAAMQRAGLATRRRSVA